MENEKRLIDANALDKKLETLKIRFKAQGRDTVAEDYNFVQTVLLTAPVVDAVEVVRCKDCKHCLSDAHGLWCFRDYEYNLQPDDFCSHGERRDKDAVD